MKIGDIIHAVYETGDIFEGPILDIREIPGKGTILFIHDDNVGYRFLYAHKCGHIVYRSPEPVSPD